MNKLNAEPYLKVFSGLVRDVEDLMGFGSGSLLGDYEVVARSVKNRGLRVLFLDLPSMCSALEKALEHGLYTKSDPGVSFHKGGYPRIFSRLYRKIFSENWTLVEEPCPEAVRLLRQLYRCYKKFNFDCPPSRVSEKIDEFRLIEDGLPAPLLTWGDDLLRSRGRYPHLVDLGNERRGLEFDHLELSEDDARAREELLLDLSNIQYVSDRIVSSFKFKREWFNPKHGPGAVSESYEGSKYEFPTWPGRLERFFPYADWGIPNYTYLGEAYEAGSSPAKLIDVPKDYKGPRLIASEPISSQYIQQGLLGVLRQNVSRSVLRHAIDFRSQEPSRLSALSASSTREYGTIDLSSASDRLSCALVECIFRRNFSLLEMLNSARTHELVYPDGTVSKLKKFAAQGAAFTFPVQSIVYALVCMGVGFSVYDTTNLADLARKVRVYGDDMIVPTRIYERVVRVLEHLFLKVNQEKSFSRGHFRESCGMDAFLGQDVTPASVRAHFERVRPDSLVSVVECANNLYQKGFIRASSALLDTIPRRLLSKVPHRESGSTGFGLIGAWKPRLRQRYCVLLHRPEVQVLTVSSKVTKTSPAGHYGLMQWFVENPSPDIVWSCGEIYSVKAKYRLRWVANY